MIGMITFQYTAVMAILLVWPICRLGEYHIWFGHCSYTNKTNKKSTTTWFSAKGILFKPARPCSQLRNKFLTFFWPPPWKVPLTETYMTWIKILCEKAFHCKQCRYRQVDNYDGESEGQANCEKRATCVVSSDNLLDRISQSGRNTGNSFFFFGKLSGFFFKVLQCRSFF